ncbi:MAG: hypothetical protein K0B10_01880 [Vicingaceae bacterium]|nr:hypothetical protein [Vicingaceae bacterium]
MRLLLGYSILSLLLILFSCKKEEVGPQCKNCIENPIIPNSDSKILIVNEGNFGFGNASISLYNPTSNVLNNNVFQQVNTYPLGDVAQSGVLFENKLYIVVNNSGKIEVVNKDTYNSIATITGLISPRHMLPINSSKAYVSNIFSNQIQILNLSNNSISGGITTSSNWTEEMLLFNDTAYVCDMKNNNLLLINTTNDLLIDSVKMGVQPNSIVIDKNNKFWILCDGGFNTDFPKLIKFNPQTRTIEQTLIFTDINSSPSDLSIDGNKENLYFINYHVYKINCTDNVLPTSNWLSNNSQVFYSIGIDPYANNIYISDAKDFVQSSSILRYSENGVLLHSFQAGINAGQFLFLP